MRNCKSVSPLISNRESINTESVPCSYIPTIEDYKDYKHSNYRTPLKVHYDKSACPSEILNFPAYQPKIESYHKGNYQRKNLSSGSICKDCLIYKSEIEKYKAIQQKNSEKILLSEKHLKQYEELLRIKDNRLTQKEISLNTQLGSIESEREWLLNERNSLAIEKESVEQQLKKFQNKVFEFNSKFGLLLKISSQKNKNSAVLNLLPAGDFSELSVTEINPDFENFDIDDFDEIVLSPIKDRLKEKKQKLKQKKIEMASEKEEFVKEKEKFDIEYQQKFEELFKQKEEFAKEVKEKLLNIENEKKQLIDKETSIKAQEIKLKEDQDLVSYELISIEELKQILKSQAENLDQEKKIFEEHLKNRVSLVSSDLSLASPVKLQGEAQQEINIDPYDELSFGRMDYSSCSDAHKEYDSKCESVQDHGFETRNSLQEKMCVSRDTMVYALDSTENPYKSTYVSPEDSVTGFSYKQKIHMLEKAKNTLENRIFEIEKDSKLKTVFYEQEHEKLNFRICQLETEKKQLEVRIQDLVKENNHLIDINQSKQDRINLDHFKKRLTQFDSYGTELVEFHQELEKQLEDLQEELKEKFNLLCEKEKEIDDLKVKLMQETNYLSSTSECLKSISDELEAQKTQLFQEKNRLLMQKGAYIELEHKQNEKIELLNSKESELLRLKEQLLDREKLFIMKKKKLSLITLKRGNTLSESSPVMKANY